MDQKDDSLASGQYLEVNRDSAAPQAQQAGLEAVPPGLEPGYVRGDRNIGISGSGYSTSHPHEKAYEVQEPERKILGLRRTTFWLTVALVLVIVLAVAVGGGVGGTMCTNNHVESDTSKADSAGSTKTTTVTTTKSRTSTVTQQVATATPSSQCPRENFQNYTSPYTDLRYTKVCGVDLDLSSPKQNLINGVVQDFDTCIGLCDSYNRWLETERMNVVIYSWDGTGTAGYQTKGTCWCVIAEKNYVMTSIDGEDAALLVGTFDASQLPG